MKNNPVYKHILILSPRKVFQESLTDVLSRYFGKPEFTYMNQLVDQLPDEQFDWADIDLMLIDVSRHKRAIYKWYAQPGLSERLPPAIFMGYPAKFKDAGYFFRAGAVDYLDLDGLKKTQLIQSLVVVSMFVEGRKNKASKPDDDKHNIPRRQPDHLLDTGEIPHLTAEDMKDLTEEKGADFVSTGIMNILQREQLRKVIESQSDD